MLLIKGGIIERKQPVNLLPKHQEFFEKEYQKVVYPVYLKIYNNIFLTSEGIIYKGLSLIKDSLLMPERRKIFNIRYFLSVILRRKKLVLNDDKYLSVFNLWYLGYFHWVTECLPKLYLLKDTLHLYTLLLPQKALDFHLKSLQPFKFKAIYYFSDKEYLLVPNLYTITQIAETGSYNIKLINNVRSFYTKYFEHIKPPVIADKIYISRKKATRRKILNEDQLEEALSNEGFQLICMEDFSFEEQVALMGQVRYLVSMHGAGLTNLLFMAPNTNVLELRPEGDKSNLCYFSLASALEINYFYEFGMPDNMENLHNANLNIDILSLRKVVEQMLNY